MRRRGTATAFGAATVLNAVANWKGSAFGVDLKTSAEVILDGPPPVKGDVPGIDDRLIVRSVERVLERFGVVAGGVVRTWSDIPLARGLKSSSAAANAVVLATLDALGEDLDPLEATRTGVAAAMDAGVTIMARPPGKRVSSISLLSGGEKAMTAVALVFAIFRLNPAPFCLLDEVDAPLDEANVGRFTAMVSEMSEQVQFLFVTHNKATMEAAQQLSGVTMREPGVSRLVSVDLAEAARLAGAA